MIEVLKQALEAFEDISSWYDYEQSVGELASNMYEASCLAKSKANELRQAIKELESQEPVAFKIYKPTPPRHAMPNVRDAELPWVYDQDPSSGNVASMWVTPVKHTHPPQRTEQEPVACDGDFPEGFDKSLDIPAQALRQANAALCEVTNNRMWDVPALAERMLMFCRNTHPPQRTWVGLTDEEENEYNYLGPDMHWVIQEIAAKLKEKNNA